MVCENVGFRFWEFLTNSLETSPVCNNCHTRNIPCEYSLSLTWEEDALKLGHAFGRSKVAKLSSDSSSHLELYLTRQARRRHPKLWLPCSRNHYFYINYSPDDFRAVERKKAGQSVVADDDDHYHRGIEANAFSHGLFVPFRSTTFANDERPMFSYMVEYIFPNCVCYGNGKGGRNPYLDYIVPLSTLSPVVYNSIVAAGANLYYLQFGDSYYRELSNCYIQSVLRDLPVQIEQKHALGRTSWDDILVTILMLCFTDISSNCDKQWLAHLRRGKSLLGHQKILDHCNEFLLKFFVRYITSHDIMWETVKNVWNSSVIDCEAGIYESLKHDNDVHVDVVLGCSPYLLTLISKTSNLGDCYEALRDESGLNMNIFEEVIVLEAELIRADLDDLRQVIDMASDGSYPVEGIEMISEIKRLTAKIYLFARIDLTGFALRPSLPSTVALLRERTAKMKALTKQIIALMKKIKTCTMAISWPLFVIGLVTVSLEDRWFVLEKFREMETNRGLASVRLARETVEASWRERDLVANSRIYTWNELVNSKGRTLSLA